MSHAAIEQHLLEYKARRNAAHAAICTYSEFKRGDIVVINKSGHASNGLRCLVKAVSARFNEATIDETIVYNLVDYTGDVEGDVILGPNKNRWIGDDLAAG